MVGSPLPAPPKNPESFTQDSSFLSLSLVSSGLFGGTRLMDSPGKGTDVVDDSDDQLMSVLIHSYDERVVHHVEVGEE